MYRFAVCLIFKKWLLIVKSIKYDVIHDKTFYYIDNVVQEDFNSKLR